MRSAKGSLAIILALIFTLSFATTGNCFWWVDDDEDDILLTRIDNSGDAPNHEIDQGVYGYYVAGQQFVVVLDFNASMVIQPPFSWSIVYWIPQSK